MKCNFLFYYLTKYYERNYNTCSGQLKLLTCCKWNVFSDSQCSVCDLFRDGYKVFFDRLSEQQVPLLIFSAGVGDVLEEVIRQNHVFHPNVRIISNYMDFDQTVSLPTSGFHSMCYCMKCPAEYLNSCTFLKDKHGTVTEHFFHQFIDFKAWKPIEANNRVSAVS